MKWADVPERVEAPQRPEKFINPDRMATAHPIWGHLGPTKLALMKWMAAVEGKGHILEKEAVTYRTGLLDRKPNETAWYFIDVRERAEWLIKFVRAEGGAIGWGDVEKAIKEREQS